MSQQRRPEARNASEAQRIVKAIAEVASVHGFEISADRATVLYRDIPGERSLLITIFAQGSLRR